jgi:hypothetical protein
LERSYLSQAEPRIDENEVPGVLQEIHSHYQTSTEKKWKKISPEIAPKEWQQSQRYNQQTQRKHRRKIIHRTYISKKLVTTFLPKIEWMHSRSY